MDTVGGNRGGDVGIDVRKLMISSYKPFVLEDFVLSSESCIFKIPNILFRHNEKAYLPNAFSFGPWHYGKQPHLKATQALKYKYLEEVLRRFPPDPSKKLAELEAAIAEVEVKARQCYAGAVGFKEDEFVKILVLDGCFIVECFRRYSEYTSCNSDDDDCDQDERKDIRNLDPVFQMACMAQFLYHDLILLENQVPWFVLELLFNLTTAHKSTASLPELAVQFFNKYFLNDAVPYEESLFVDVVNDHILDFLRNCLLLKMEKEDNQLLKQQPVLGDRPTELLAWFSRKKIPGRPLELQLPSARQLRESGIRFKRGKGKRSILDIKFVKADGVLEIPPLLIHETTETFFKNIISFEQCYPCCLPVVTCYAKFMDNLIDTDEDTEILITKGVIDTWLEPGTATQILNKLYQDTFIEELFYGELCQEVNTYYLHWWHKWRAFYVRNYFTDRKSVV